MKLGLLTLALQLVATHGSSAAEQNEATKISTSTVRVMVGGALDATHFRLVAVRVDRKGPGPADWEVAETVRGIDEKGAAWAAFRLPAGRFAVLVDLGPALPPLVGDIDLKLNETAVLNAKEVDSHAVSVRVRNPAKAPVVGARISPWDQPPPERALALLLSGRAGASKKDGVLRLGLVPAGAPLRVQVSANGYRSSVLKLGANFEAGQRDVILVPNQDVEVRVSGLAQRRGDSGAQVTLARCRIQREHSSCNPMEGRSVRLNEEGRAHFERVEGGLYSVVVAAPGLGATRQIVEVASEGEAPVLLVEMPVGQWTLRGITRLSDGTPRPASVRAMEFVNGLGEETSSTTRSAPDGSFELKVISAAGHLIALNAEADDPPSVAGPTEPVTLDESERVIENLVVELDATALEISVHDARSGEPLPECPVRIEWERTGETSYRTFSKLTDEKGKARQYALAGGTVRGDVRCRGHYGKDIEETVIARDQLKTIDLALEPSRDVLLTASDDGGTSVSGATVLALVDPLSTYLGVGRLGNVARVGTTDERGAIVLSGEQYGGLPVFIVSSGRAVAQVIPPAPSSCDRVEDCRLDVKLHRPTVFGGLTVRNESGLPVAASDIVFLRDGIPFPYQILALALAANGLAPDATAAPLDVRGAALLPEGAYSLSTPRISTDAPTGKGAWKPYVVGAFAVPSVERIELLNRDGTAPPMTAPIR